MHVDVGRGVMAGEVLARNEAGEDAFGMRRLQRRPQRTVADEDEPQAGIGTRAWRRRRGRAADSFFPPPAGRHGARRPRRWRRPSAARSAGERCAGENWRVSTPRESTPEPGEAGRGEFAAQLHGRREGAKRAIVHVAQPGEGEPAQRREPIMAGIDMKVGVEARRDRQAQRPRGGDGGGAERALRGDVHEIGTIGAPALFQPAPRGQAEPEQRVARDGQAGQGHSRNSRLAAVVRQIGPPRPVDRHRVTPAAEFAGDDAKGHRHAVDLGREGFGDDGELHMSGWAGTSFHHQFRSRRVTSACRPGDDCGKSMTARGLRNLEFRVALRQAVSTLNLLARCKGTDRNASTLRSPLSFGLGNWSAIGRKISASTSWNRAAACIATARSARSS